jgi:hypothetical protein
MVPGYSSFRESSGEIGNPNSAKTWCHVFITTRSPFLMMAFVLDWVQPFFFGLRSRLVLRKYYDTFTLHISLNPKEVCANGGTTIGQ